MMQIDSCLRNGSLGEAVALAVRAQSTSERAFFDENMLPMLYFSDEHLLAVFAPFFLPVGIHVLGRWVSACKKS